MTIFSEREPHAIHNLSEVLVDDSSANSRFGGASFERPGFAAAPGRVSTAQPSALPSLRLVQNSDKNWNKNLFQIAAYSPLGAMVLGIAAYLGYLSHFNFATAAFVSLVVVVLLSSFGSMVSSTIHSTAAVAWLDYFFAPPIHSLQVSDPRNVLALAAFLATSLGITFQVTRVRRERQTTAHERQEVNRLYQLAQQLMAFKAEEIDTPRLLTLFQEVYALRSVCLFENETAHSCIVGKPRYDLEARTRMGYLTGEDSDDPLCRISVRCLRVDGNNTSVLGFEWPDSGTFTSDSLSALEASILERVRAFHAAAQAAVSSQADSVRIMLLDALAHAVKTPLATILAATGGMRETSGSGSVYLDFIDIVEAETSRLADLTTRLLRTASINSELVKLRLQRVDIQHLIAEELGLKSQEFEDHSFSLTKEGECEDSGGTEIHEVDADPELLRMALAQLLENACKYSKSGSTVNVTTGFSDGSLAVRVRSCSYVGAPERSKIFDRFYRGAAARDSISGTGLGLDIARKIVLAHGGTLALEGSSESESIFRISLPISVKEL
jgi:two-component system sensor histidine kinase KdpD